MFTLLIFISFAIISAYSGLMIARHGVPYSISATFYRLNHRWVFQATMFSTAALLMPAILEKTQERYQCLAFLACAGMLFVAASPNFKGSFEGKVHASGAVAVLLFSQVWVAVTCPYILPLWAVLAGYLITVTRKRYNGNLMDAFISSKPMFWAEITALITTYSTLIIY